MAIPIKQTVQENVRALLGLDVAESGVSKLMKRGFANVTAQRKPLDRWLETNETEP